MSSPHNLSTSSDSDEDELMKLLMDDTDEQMMFEILEEEHMLLELAQRPRSRKYLHRDHERAHTELMKDYFDENPTWCPNTFRRRFRMRKELFTRIVSVLESHDEYFQWRVDAAGRKGVSPLQKCMVAIKQLAYGGLVDHYVEDSYVAETTSIDCLINFCRCVNEVFGEYYLRKPNIVDCQRLARMHEHRYNFPGMLGSLDCMNWKWRNCPIVWKDQFNRGNKEDPTIMLEAVASADLWIWHAFFGVVGSNNSINVLNQSLLFIDDLQGRAPNVNFTINDMQYTQGYYLTDRIYPKLATFVKSFQCPQDPKKKKFKKMQEAARKDVERAFGLLQARWAMIRGPNRICYKSNLKDIMNSCIILHNMIIEDEGDMSSDWMDEVNINESSNNKDPHIIQGSVGEFNDYLMRGFQDKEKHHQLRANLVEHVWSDNN